MFNNLPPSIPPNYQSLPSTSSISSTTVGLGQYIAAGLAWTSTNQALASIITTSTAAFSADYHSPGHPGEEAVRAYTRNESKSNVTETSVRVTQISNAEHNVNNASLACWPQWSSFWSFNDSLNSATKPGHPTTTLPTTMIYTMTQPAVSSWASTQLDLETTTVPMVANGYTYQTSTFTTTRTAVFGQPSFSGGTITITSTGFETLWESRAAYTGPTLQVPNCTLETFVPQCQSLWEDYAASHLDVPAVPTDACVSQYLPYDQATSFRRSLNLAEVSLDSIGRLRPHCTQASVGPLACSYFQDHYMTSWILANDGRDPFEFNTSPFLSVGYQYKTSYDKSGYIVSESQYWPTSSILAPGCTLGCGQCAITGGSVRLLYWPTTSTGSISIGADASMSAQYPATILTLGTSLVSPTVYISYDKIYASNSCSGLGTTASGIIMPIEDPGQLSSVWQTWGMCTQSTAQFNFTDLNPPVPQSIFDRQPQCASWSQWALVQGSSGIDNWNSWTRSWICPRTGDYAPILAVPESKLRSIDPQWSTCRLDLRGEFDPPTALTRGSVAAVPTSTDPFPSPTSLRPASSPMLEQPRPTGPPMSQTSDSTTVSDPPSDPSSPGKPVSSDQNGDPSVFDSHLNDDKKSAPHPLVTGQGDPLIHTSPPLREPSPHSVANALMTMLIGHGNMESHPHDRLDHSGHAPSSRVGESGTSEGGFDRSWLLNAVASAQIGNNAIVRDPAVPGGIILDGFTLTLGQEVALDGLTISHGPSNIVLNGHSTITIGESGRNAQEDQRNSDFEGAQGSDPEGLQTLDPSFSAYMHSTADISRNTEEHMASSTTQHAYDYTSSAGTQTISGSSIPANPMTDLAAAVASVGAQHESNNNGLQQLDVFTDLTGHSHTIIQVSNDHHEAVLDGVTTISIGGPEATISGDAVSLASGGVVVDGNIELFSTSSAVRTESVGQMGHKQNSASDLGDPVSSTSEPTSTERGQSTGGVVAAATASRHGKCGSVSLVIALALSSTLCY
ncbi:MAG: hypothetical protein M1820_010474 [Bogoriella megaspora]|nr:MAG: hypothetical protein M1820_010474 [Bogoriella megaspora]